MRTKVETSSGFNKDFRRLERKYRNLLCPLVPFIALLASGSRPGVRVRGTGYQVYKERLGIPAANRGKSSGLRLIYHFRAPGDAVLLSLYSK